MSRSMYSIAFKIQCCAGRKFFLKILKAKNIGISFSTLSKKTQK